MRSGQSDAAQLTPYELKNLVAHLETAGREDTLHWLLALETDAGTNFWFEAKDQGDPGGYVTDSQRALRLVRRAVDARVRAGEPTREIASEIRYALLIASVGSAAGQVPTALLTAMVEKGVRSAEEVLAYLSQTHGGRPRFDVIASLSPYLPEPVRKKQLRDALDLLSLDEPLDDRNRFDALSMLTPYLPPDLMDEALRVARTIKDESYRARALAALGPRLPAQLHDEGVAAASEIQETSLRIAASAALGIATSRESLRTALAEIPRPTYWDEVQGPILMAATLPPELLGEVLAAARTFDPNRAKVLTALAPRLPDDQLPEAVRIVQKMGDYDHAGEILATLAPRLSGAALQCARRSAARFHKPEDRIRALNELALRYPEHDRDRILRSSLEAAERATFGSREMQDAVVRLLELLPQQLLPRALTLARKIDPNKGGTAVLVAVGARLAGRRRKTVLRAALQDTPRMDDDELAWLGMTSAEVLAKLAVLLPGEVLPFVLDDVRPDETGYWSSTTWREWSLTRLSAIAPHLQKQELREAQRAVRELEDGVDQCAAIAALVDYVHEPGRSELLRASLDACRRIRRRTDQERALHILAPKLSEDLGAEALEIAESIRYEDGARARAEVACSVPPRLFSRAIAVGPGYERWRAVASAAMAKKVEEPTKTELFQQALARVGITDWDDTLANGVDFIGQLAPDLPEQMLGEALDKALNAPTHGGSRDRVPALRALAPRFDGPERMAILEKALAAAQTIDRESDRVQALIDLGAEVPGVTEAIRQVGDAKWRAFGLAELGEPVQEEAMRAPIGSLSDLDNVQVTLNLLPFAPSDQVRAVLSELQESEEWPRLIEGEWLPYEFAALAPRLGAEFLPDLADVAHRIPPSTRLPVLAALVSTFRPLPPRQLHDCWVQARPALDNVSRSNVLKAVAALAPVVDAVGGRMGVQDSAASVHLVARWHP
jgi:hypothetical protein